MAESDLSTTTISVIIIIMLIMVILLMIRCVPTKIHEVVRILFEDRILNKSKGYPNGWGTLLTFLAETEHSCGQPSLVLEVWSGKSANNRYLPRL